MSDLSSFVSGLPKVELHVHHVGAASPRIVAELAARHEGTSPVPTDPERLREYFVFTDLAHFIDVYLSVVDLVRTPDDVAMLTYEVARDLAGQAVRYAELTVTPYTSVVRGMAAEAFCEALEDARQRASRDFGIEFAWTFDIPGEYGIPGADATLDIALNVRPDGLLSFGLGGPEVGVSRAQFATHFDRARAAGLHSVPHAGESVGPESVWEAIRDLKAERIGHGIAAAQDPELMAYLARTGIPLEVCPTSNLRTRSVPSLEEHPLPQLVAAGVPVSINSDDPPMFSTTLNEEYLVAARLLDLDADGTAELAKAGVRASFLPDGRKRALLADIDAHARAHPATAAG